MKATAIIFLIFSLISLSAISDYKHNLNSYDFKGSVTHLESEANTLNILIKNYNEKQH